MKKFTFWRTATSLIEESYWVEADSEEEARELGFDGEVDNSEPAYRRWIDYTDDEWSIDEKECIDPLYLMVKDFESVDKLVE